MQDTLGVRNGTLYLHEQMRAMAPELTEPVTHAQNLLNGDQRIPKLMRLLNRRGSPLSITVYFNLQHKGADSTDSGDYEFGHFTDMTGDIAVLEAMRGMPPYERCATTEYLGALTSAKRYKMLADTDPDAEMPSLLSHRIKERYPDDDDAGYQMDLYADLKGSRVIPKVLPGHPKDTMFYERVMRNHARLETVRKISAAALLAAGYAAEDIEKEIDLLSKDVVFYHEMSCRYVDYIVDIITKDQGTNPKSIAMLCSYGFVPVAATLREISEDINQRSNRTVMDTVGHFTTGTGGNVAMPPLFRAHAKMSRGHSAQEVATHLLEQVEFSRLYWQAPLPGRNVTAGEVFGIERSGDLFAATVIPYELACPQGRSAKQIVENIRHAS